MSTTTLAVRAEDLRNVTGGKRFVALPQEEIDRHFASIEVLEAERKPVYNDPSLKQLVVFVALHHNYSWLTHRTPTSQCTLGLGIAAPIQGDGAEHLFLDDYGLEFASIELENHLRIPDRPDIRLAGLLDDDRVGLIYIARLRQRVAESRGSGLAELHFRGIGDLLEARDEFDAWSQVLIDSLHAL